MTALDEAALDSAVESVLLAAGGPVTLSALAAATEGSTSAVRMSLHRLAGRLTGGIRLQLDGASAQLVTAPENIETVHRFLGTERPPALSRAAIETLVVVAYRQPVTRAEIGGARGVNSDRAVQTLRARGLIEEAGTRDVLGRPMQYATTFGFLEYFGLSSLSDLPPVTEDPEIALDPTRLGLRSDSK